ncbi:MAG: hypothetical protein GF331_18700 [Chitinivibrionales bacterium]|nr:hypothetical protein [Chitinivibrionales bacterium]
MRGVRGVTFLLTATLLLCTCADSPTDPQAGNGSQTGNPAVLGSLYYADGRPAENAVVRFLPVSHVSSPLLTKQAAVGYTAVTDPSGTYRFDSLPTQHYTVLGDGGGYLSYQDSVLIESDTTTRVPADTLRTPGSLSGTVRLQNNGDYRTVLVLVFGEGTFTWVDNDGVFTLSNMAQGVYRVRFLSTLDDYLPLDTTLSVVAGRRDTLDNHILLRTRGLQPPVPAGASFDTARGVARIEWRPVTDSNVSQIRVYRSNSVLTESDMIAVTNPHVLTLLDTIALGPLDTNGYQIEYRLRSADSTGRLSDYSAPMTVTVAPARLVETALRVTPEQWVVSVGDTVSIAGAFSNPTRRIENVQWSAGAPPQALREIAWNAPTGVDTVALVAQLPGSTTVYLRTVDAAGDSACDSARLAVSPWTLRSPMPTARMGLLAVAAGGKVYAIGGTDRRYGTPLQAHEVFDPVTDSWSDAAPMPTARSYLCGAVVNDTVYAVGGMQLNGTPVDVVERYVPATDAWSACAALPSPVHSAACAAARGRVYVFGGSSIVGRARDQVYRYTPLSDRWDSVGVMPTERERAAAVAVGDTILVVGGVNSYLSPVREHGTTLSAFDIMSGTWTAWDAMPIAAYDCAVALSGDTMLVVGGLENPSVTACDVATRSWETRGPLVPGRYGLAACTTSGRVFVIGGANEGKAVEIVEECSRR